MKIKLIVIVFSLFLLLTSCFSLTDVPTNNLYPYHYYRPNWYSPYWYSPYWPNNNYYYLDQYGWQYRTYPRAWRHPRRR